jgi:hypothetical protein
LIPEISEAIKNSEDQKLSPVYQMYNGKYNYNDLKIIRILLNAKN